MITVIAILLAAILIVVVTLMISLGQLIHIILDMKAVHYSYQQVKELCEIAIMGIQQLFYSLVWLLMLVLLTTVLTLDLVR